MNLEEIESEALHIPEGKGRERGKKGKPDRIDEGLAAVQPKPLVLPVVIND